MSTLNRVYPIFTQGKALPQRIQQNIAPRQTTIGLVKNACADNLFADFRRSGFYCFVHRFQSYIIL